MRKLRGLTMVMALGMAVSGTAMAEGENVGVSGGDPKNPYGTMLISENYDVITVNGVVLEGAKIIEDEGTKMIPLRAICEALDFEVTWNDEARRIELIKMPAYITLTPDEDGYTFAKTAPMKLGKAPIMRENRTYVPVNFIDEILQGAYNEEGGINITWGTETEEKVVSENEYLTAAYIKEATEEGFLVEDFSRGEVRLAVSEETVIVDAEGNEIKKEDIDTTKELLVEYSQAMTMSLPPLTNAVKITVKNENARPVLSGEITEVIKDGDKVIQLVLGDNEAVLNIGEDLDVRDTEGNVKEVEFEAGMNVRALTKGMATMSIPPQYPVSAIIVVE